VIHALMAELQDYFLSLEQRNILRRAM
jgi:hypothetical protein